MAATLANAFSGRKFSDRVADGDLAAGDDAAVAAAEMELHAAGVVHERAGLGAVALLEFAAAGVRFAVDFNDDALTNRVRIADSDTAPRRQVFLAQVEIDDQIVAGQRDRILMPRDLAQEAGVHQRDLAQGVVRFFDYPAVAFEASLGRDRGGGDDATLVGCRPHDDRHQLPRLTR